MKTILDFLGRIPSALVGAVLAAVGILMLILRGRRLEAELAQAKLREQKAKAKLHAAEHQGMRAVYEKQANQAAAEVRELEKEADRIREENEGERKRLDGMSGADIHKEYLELAKRAKERARE